MSKPPTIADLVWTHGLVYEATSGTQTLTLDGNSREGASPVQTLAISLAGCMSIDVADILAKGRHPFRAIRSHLIAERAQEDPHRFVSATLRFTVQGAVPPDAVARAIALSHDKYCSVWHSMRQDIAFTTAFDVEP
jgi:putative redox protein